MKLISKYSFFNFVANFWDKRDNLVIRKVLRGCCNVSETNWRNCPSKPREIWPFSHFRPIFHPSLPKIGHSDPVKNFFQ